MGVKASLTIAAAVLCSSQAFAGASAFTEDHPAKGERKCFIKQLTSEYLQEDAEAKQSAAGLKFYVKTSSYVAFKVLKSGALLAAVSEDVYPGSTVYFSIGGRRYSARSNAYVQLDAPALAALRQEALIDFTYTDWPYRHEISRKDKFRGFAKAFDDCSKFMTGAKAPVSGNNPAQPKTPLDLTPKN